MPQQLIFTNGVADALAGIVAAASPDRIFIVADDNTAPFAPQLALPQADVITIAHGDVNKSLDSLQTVWERLSRGGATRRSFMVNLGGGMVTDLGGFAAACFKRGIRFANVPTTLLGAVDAAVGGKTGINFMHLKNEIGAFCPADAVVISTRFFATLPPHELMSGYAEMLKHGLLSSADEYYRLLAFDPLEASADELLPLLQASVGVKRRIVEQDPREEGLRRALNLGHTAAHAFETMAMDDGRPIAHGYAVAHGLLIDMILSQMLLGYPSAEVTRFAAYLREYYAPQLASDCEANARLVAMMRHDKKNRSVAEINFTLLDSPGAPRIDCTASPDTIAAALDIYRSLLA